MRGMNAPARPPGIPLRPDATALAAIERRRFVRAITARVLGTMRRESAQDIARRAWADDGRVTIMLAAYRLSLIMPTTRTPIDRPRRALKVTR